MSSNSVQSEDSIPMCDICNWNKVTVELGYTIYCDECATLSHFKQVQLVILNRIATALEKIGGIT